LLVAGTRGCTDQRSSSSAEANDCGQLFTRACRIGRCLAVALGDCEARGITSSLGLTVDRRIVGTVTDCRRCFGSRGRRQLEGRLP